MSWNQYMTRYPSFKLQHQTTPIKSSSVPVTDTYLMRSLMSRVWFCLWCPEHFGKTQLWNENRLSLCKSLYSQLNHEMRRSHFISLLILNVKLDRALSLEMSLQNKKKLTWIEIETLHSHTTLSLSFHRRALKKSCNKFPFFFSFFLKKTLIKSETFFCASWPWNPVSPLIKGLRVQQGFCRKWSACCICAANDGVRHLHDSC